MEKIEIVSRLDKSKLSEEYYCHTLLEQAYLAGMLSDKDMEKIQLDCLAILAQQTESYNGGDSSSVRVEVAQSILSSIMFTIGVALKHCPCPDEAVAALQREGITNLYNQGSKRIDMMLKRAKMLHSAILSKLVDTKNVFYRSTIEHGIKGFFKLYYPDFGAQEIHITADYPVYNKMSRLVGIEFMQAYLESIYFENMFCCNFSAEDIHHLLCGYDTKYDKLLFNIYEPILTSAIGCVLVHTDPKRLALTSDAISTLRTIFQGKNRNQIHEVLSGALEQLAQILAMPQPLKQYVIAGLPQLASAVEIACERDTIDKLFILPKYLGNEPKLHVSFGEKMEDKAYTRVLDEFIECKSTKGRMDIIKESIHSLADLEDILLDAELYPEEVTEILKELSSPEIAVFVKKYIGEYAVDSFELRDSEKVLCDCLREFVQSLTDVQKSWLDKMIKALTD